jgi:hypothetical protein
MTRRLSVAAAAAFAVLALAACSKPIPSEPPPQGVLLDPIGRDFVALALEVDNYDPGFVDAYYGDPALQTAAKLKPRTADQLKAEAQRLMAAAEKVNPAGLSPIEQKRRTYLIGQSKAAFTRLEMKGGKTLSFQDEAEALFGVRPQLFPLESYEPTLARIEALVPGPGPLPERVDAFNKKYIVPADKLDAVMKAAIAECRKRTVAHITLPANEKFDLEFVKNKPWSGYNWYKGDGHSLIQVNTDLPVRIGRAVDLGCHEGYPGHHVLNLLTEENLTRKRGWAEFAINPLYGPQSLISEGSANYGIKLAFPGDDELKFEKAVLYPLAGLDPATADAYDAMRKASAALTGVQNTVANDYLAGRIDKAAAIALLQKYSVNSKATATQRVSFIDTYRSYIINYGIGMDMVEAHIVKAGDQSARWKAMEALLSEPSVPSDLK